MVITGRKVFKGMLIFTFGYFGIKIALDLYYGTTEINIMTVTMLTRVR